MTHVTCRLTANNREQLRNPTLGNRVRATFFTATSTLGRVRKVQRNVTDLGRLKPQALLEMFENERDEDVESFADGLKHDQVQRNADQRVQHTEELATPKPQP